MTDSKINNTINCTYSNDEPLLNAFLFEQVLDVLYNDS